jgi:hypothetical protein
MWRPGWLTAIFLAVFSFYLLTSSRETAWGDAHGMYDVADNLVSKGSIEIGFQWPTDIRRGRNDKLYCISPVMTSLPHVPGAALEAVSRAVWPKGRGLMKPIATHVGPAALGALTCVLLFLLCRQIGARTRTASLTAALLAVATTTWVYARYPYSEIVQMAAFTGLFYQALRVRAAPTLAGGLWLGLWAGALFNSKYIHAVAISGCAAFLLLTLWSRRDALLRVLAGAAITGSAFFFLALLYNYLRWSDVTSSGYEGYLANYFGGSLFDGTWGMWFSPNKSALLYSPPLVLALVGLPSAWRHHRIYLVALLFLLVPTLLVFGTYKSWTGDYAWGPRFFVFCVPVLMASFALFWDHVASRWHRRVRAAALAVVLVTGVGVQIVGNAFYWDHFIRIAMDARVQWLGKPNRGGAYVPERGRGHCDSCFEDMHGVIWLPPFSPIKGHAWLLSSLIDGDDARAAEKTAPWHRYTSLTLDIGRTYPSARLDWWGMLWIKDHRHTRPVGIALLVLFLAATGAGVLAWIRLHRRADDPEPAREAAP